MKEYIISFIIVAVIGSMVTMLSPDGEGGGLGKHTRLAVGLCIVLFCSAPLMKLVLSVAELDVISLFPDLSEEESQNYDKIFVDSFNAAELDRVKEGVVAILQDKFGIDASECSVAVSAGERDGGGRRIERIVISLYGSAIWTNTGEIEGYLFEIFGCEIVTVIG